eukprot:TRINITY_DN15036_c0_g1_i1.p1 TRINITY_DN15036_c0_g1~~TRINITY_DN15036_c0_g1_i1.p1  ORF type:complete len:381 (+),score=41.92 TRINITY_DN15036_c0_g1_i1:43-1185(+)
MSIEVVVTYPDTFKPVVAEVDTTTTASDLIIAAAAEWEVDDQLLDLQLESESLVRSSRVLLYGIAAGAEFTVVERSIFSVADLRSAALTNKVDVTLSKLFQNCPNRLLKIDAALSDDVLNLNGIPEDIKNISFINASHITSIGEKFLTSVFGRHSQVTAVDLSALSNITEIGMYFFSQSQVASIDLSQFTKVTDIGDGFLYSCCNLDSLDLSSLGNVTTVDKYFLSKCDGLETVDFSPLSITVLKNEFLGSCDSLKSIVPCTGITSIQDNVFSRSQSLKSIEMSPLASVTEIGYNFCYYNTSLVSVDLSPLVNVTSIGNGFFYLCKGLTVHGISELVNVTSVGRQFLPTELSSQRDQLHAEVVARGGKIVLPKKKKFFIK